MAKKKKLKRIARSGRLSAEQVAKDREVRRKIQDEFPPAPEEAIADSLSEALKRAIQRVTLDGVFSMIRRQRNEAGHPTGKKVAREVTYANSTVFPIFVKTVYSIIHWLNANPLPP